MGPNGADSSDGSLTWSVIIDVCCSETGCCVVWTAVGKDFCFDSGATVSVLIPSLGDMTCVVCRCLMGGGRFSLWWLVV